jgi:hypothetical protein
MNADKRGPLLADRFIARRYSEHERVYHPKAVDQMVRAARSAARFVFNEDAIRRIARVITDVPDLIAREFQFARAPFEQTWIEFPAWALWDEMTNSDPELVKLSQQSGRNMGNADHTVAYLIDHGRVNTISAGTYDKPNGLPFITPLQYHLNTEWPLRDQIAFCERFKVSRYELCAIAWGSSFYKIPKEADRALRDNNVIELTPLNPTIVRAPVYNEVELVRQSLSGAVGDMRNLVGMLLMLNRPKITQFRNILPGRGWVKGKVIPFLSHNTVTVSLDATVQLRQIGKPGEDQALRRRHRVRGHYCHDQVARDYMRIAGCVHQFEPTHKDWTPAHGLPADEVDNWVCDQCGGKRWWREEHDRGTAQVGFVVNDLYQITDRKD